MHFSSTGTFSCCDFILTLSHFRRESFFLISSILIIGFSR